MAASSVAFILFSQAASNLFVSTIFITNDLDFTNTVKITKLKRGTERKKLTNEVSDLCKLTRFASD